MKCTIPEISWHNRDPVLSIDIQPSEKEDFYRLASGGSDCHVLVCRFNLITNVILMLTLVDLEFENT